MVIAQVRDPVPHPASRDSGSQEVGDHVMPTWMQVIWVIALVNRRSQSLKVDALFPGKAGPKLKNCFKFDGIAHFSREPVGRLFHATVLRLVRPMQCAESLIG